MRQITEVLRLNAQGLSYRQIAQSVGISASTVQSYLERAQRHGLSWPLPDDLDNAAIEARLFTRSEEELRPGRPEPDWLEVHRDHKRGKHVTLQLLHLEYKAVHPEGLSYTQFCVHYRRWRARQDVVMRLEYTAGERMFVDFAGDTVPVTDLETGEIWNAQVFVSVLGASGYLYVEATRSQDLASWLGAHVRALEFYGGSVRAVVPDNLKSGVTVASWYEPELNSSYLEWARAYSVAILPARPYRPRDKAAAEVGVQVAERWILAPCLTSIVFAGACQSDLPLLVTHDQRVGCPKGTGVGGSGGRGRYAPCPRAASLVSRPLLESGDPHRRGRGGLPGSTA